MSKKYNDRILVTGAPRSGTSMFNLLMTYFKDLEVFENGTPPDLWEHTNIFTTQFRHDGKLWNDFIKEPTSVIDFVKDGVKVIVIYRDGRDCMVSKRVGHDGYWYSFPIDINKWILSSKHIVELKEQIKNKDYENKLMLVKYEDFCENPKQYMKDVEKFVGHKLDNSWEKFHLDYKDTKNMSTEGAIGTEHKSLRPITPNHGRWKSEKYDIRIKEILSKYKEEISNLLIDLDYEKDKGWLKRYELKPISFISPSRNNLSYLKWMYNSIRKNLGYRHEILLADDFSSDGTWEWLQEIKEKDVNVKIFRNEGPERQGIVYWYDYLCEQANNDIVMFLHADMYVTPGLDKEIDKYIKPGVVVTATRIEPSLHPPGPEKILADYGIEPDEFDEFQFLKDLDKFKQNKTTEGVFAPWAIYKDDYWAVGGHDKLFAPQSKEDSDIFNRLHLNGCKFVQTWDGFVYHMTSRGSRFNPMAGGAPGKDSPEWLHTTTKNMRNFIRKWGTVVKHDSLMKPIVVPKYDIGFVVKNCNENLLQTLEPFSSKIYVDTYAQDYIDKEQPNTLYNLNDRIFSIDVDVQNDIEVRFDGSKLTNENFQYIQQLPEILANDEELEEGSFELDIFEISINKIKTYEEELIK